MIVNPKYCFSHDFAASTLIQYRLTILKNSFASMSEKIFGRGSMKHATNPGTRCDIGRISLPLGVPFGVFGERIQTERRSDTSQNETIWRDKR
jgi:hypothetical protein